MKFLYILYNINKLHSKIQRKRRKTYLHDLKNRIEKNGTNHGVLRYEKNPVIRFLQGFLTGFFCKKDFFRGVEVAGEGVGCGMR